MDNIATGEGSFIVMLSAELIEQIAQVHFNKVMFKQAVVIVDSKATEAGYAFTLTLTDIKKPTVKSRRIFPPAVGDTRRQKPQLEQLPPVESLPHRSVFQHKPYELDTDFLKRFETPSGDAATAQQNGVPQRDSKGRFTKHANTKG